MRFLSTVLGLLLLASGLSAQQLRDCDWVSSARNIVEPWQENTRQFSNGKVRLTMMDTTEPASGSYYLMIISPPYGVLGAPQCQIVGKSHGLGFAGMHFSQLEADYDPARGLLFRLPVEIYDPETSYSNAAVLSVQLNQATGVIETDIGLGRE